MSVVPSGARHAALVSPTDQIRMRLFAEASTTRSAELASALTRCLASHGDVQVHEAGTYWKIPAYIEFDVDLAVAVSASVGVARLRAVAPAGWSGDVWNHQPGGSTFLLAEIRWAWLTTVSE